MKTERKAKDVDGCYDNDIEFINILGFEKSESEIKENFVMLPHLQNIASISRDHTFSMRFLKEFEDQLAWDKLSEYQKWSVEKIKFFSDRIDFLALSFNENLDEEVIDAFSDRLHFGVKILQHQLTIEMFLKHIDKINLNHIAIEDMRSFSEEDKSKLKSIIEIETAFG